MGEAGVLSCEGRHELVGGEIYEIMPPGPLHAYLVGIIGGLLDHPATPRGAPVREEKPIELSDGYHPQPDVAVVQGPERSFRNRFPRADEVLLIVEVADSSLDRDRNLKLPALASAGIPAAG